jgi:hypothetical protein
LRVLEWRVGEGEEEEREERRGEERGGRDKNRKIFISSGLSSR